MPVFIDLHETKMAETEAAFERYLSALAVGDDFELAARPKLAPENLAGAIWACIRRGITRERDILNAVSRFADCSRADVFLALFRLTESPSGLLVEDYYGVYSPRPNIDADYLRDREAFID